MRCILPLLLSLCVTACGQARQPQQGSQPPALANAPAPSAYGAKVAEAALGLTESQVRYDPTYFRIPYPNGDVPADRGVCTDVVIRTYRKLGVDLQRLVHEDMKAHFGTYPKKWGLHTTDTNIDHRRVPNLMTFFARHGQTKPTSKQGRDYVPGDIVTWNLPGNLTHIGIVANRLSTDRTRPLIVHNIGRGQELSDCLFSWPITGHYRYERP
jgi:uncharacterized protein